MNATKKFVKVSLMLLTVAALVTMGGCMQNDNNTANEPSVMPSAVSTPTPTSGIGSSGNPGAVGGASFDWATGAQQVEDNINRLSEIADNRVVVTGTTALVGVKYTAAYQGETTERIREMIAGVVRQSDPAIQTVAVTSQTEDVETIYQISDKIKNGTSADDMAEEINRIVRNATTLR